MSRGFRLKVKHCCSPESGLATLPVSIWALSALQCFCALTWASFCMERCALRRGHAGRTHRPAVKQRPMNACMCGISRVFSALRGKSWDCRCIWNGVARIPWSCLWEQPYAETEGGALTHRTPKFTWRRTLHANPHVRLPSRQHLSPQTTKYILTQSVF